MLKNRDFYFRNFVITVIAFSVLAVLFQIFYGGTLKIDDKSFYFALIVNVLNSVIGFRLLLKAMDSNAKKFYLYSLGSMTVRLFVILLMVIVGLLGFKLSKISFIFALFFFYFLFLILETTFLIKRNNYIKRVE